MTEFDRTKSLFIHIPKTAGTSVARTIYKVQTGHTKWAPFYYALGKETYNSYFKFAFVRNPYERLFSAFNYLCSERCTPSNKKWVGQNGLKKLSFEEFVLTKLEQVIDYVHFIPQTDFIYNRSNELMVDFVGKFENLDSDFNFVCTKLKLNLELEARNLAPVPPVKQEERNVFTIDMIKIINDCYSRDFELLKYDLR